MNRDEAEKRGIKTISDLAKAVNGGAKLTFASNAEFAERPDGLKPLAGDLRLRFRPRQREAHGQRADLRRR